MWLFERYPVAGQAKILYVAYDFPVVNYRRVREYSAVSYPKGEFQLLRHTHNVSRQFGPKVRLYQLHCRRQDSPKLDSLNNRPRELG